MSVALAIAKIGEYSAKYDAATQRINEIQQQLQLAGFEALNQGQQVNPNLNEQLRKQLAVYMFLQGLYKEFTDFWKEVIKSVLALLKSLSELAQGAR